MTRACWLGRAARNQEGVNDARVGLEERRAVDRARHRRREEFLEGRWVVIAQRQRRKRGE